MKRRIIVLGISCLISLIARAQGNELPQVFSPNAAELGKYGRIPVNYFTGLPNITIPLTEVKAKNYTLPIYLSYHASGNKPEQHPGWVGQGWTLHAGGCINRIIRGMKDEMTKDDDIRVGVPVPTEHPGYLYHMGEAQSTDWTDLNRLSQELEYNAYKDYEPDEYQICIDDIQASFYLKGGGDIGIVSRSGEDFSVEYVMKDHIEAWRGIFYYPNIYEDAYAKTFDYIEEFIVTKSDGTKYYFGGSDEAIEFSAVHTPEYGFDQGSSTPQNVSLSWNLKAVANTWMLTKIERPDGEAVYLKYKQEGIPIVYHDSHSAYSYSYPGNSVYYISTSDDKHLNQQFVFLKPSYLESVCCRYGADSLSCKTSRSVQLDYDYTESDFGFRVGYMMPLDSVKAHSYYLQLDTVVTNRGLITFDYTQDSSTRLKLNAVRVNQSEGTVLKYGMEYSSQSLPRYNSRKTDIWGYYNTAVSYNVLPFETLAQRRRSVNSSLLLAEMLTCINWPTGGRTEFEYEPHDYAKVANQFPFMVAAEVGQAGGLRIKKIRDIPQDGDSIVRYFDYSNNGMSSGILSGDPKCYTNGHHYVNVHHGEWMGLAYYHIDLEYDANYFFFSEHVLNQLSTTDNRHVTYTKVTESVQDSGRVEYTYYNHDDSDMLCVDQRPTCVIETIDNKVLNNSFNSMELCRGLLKSKRQYDETGRLVQEECYRYSQDTTKAVFSVKRYYPFQLFYRASFSKIFTYFPALIRKTVTTYPDGGGEPVVETTDYEWNDHRQLVRTVRRDSLHREERRVLYSGDMPAYGDYGRMQSAWILNRPVEETVLHDGAVVSSVLTTWRQEDSLFVPDCHYEARLWEPFTGDWPVYEGIVGSWQRALYGEPRKRFDRYDAYGNVLELTEEGAVNSQYYWSPDGVHPEASFRQMVRPAQRYWHNGTGHREDVFQGKMVSRYDIDFTADYAGPASLDMMFHNGLGYSLSGVMDGDTVFHYVCPSRDVILPVTTLWEGTVSAGPHRLTLSVPGDEIFPLGDMGISQIFYLEGSTLLFYPVRKERVSYENLSTLYESFESGGTRSGGFHSDHSWAGARTVSLNTPYGVCYTVDWMELCHDGVWRYRRSPFSGTVTVGGGAVAVDNVRVYPNGAEVQSWTWWENGELRSMTDGKGRTESYAYDGLARLVSVTDEEGNTTKAYEYQYSNNE